MFGISVFVGLLIVGYVFGRIAEQRHFASIREREARFADLLAFSTRLPPKLDHACEPVLVGGCVVVSVDFFKQVAAGLRALFGGRVSVFETLIERARREALLRMKAQARELGAGMVCNVKLETSSISKGAQQQIGAVEVYAYGTALVPRRP